MVAWEEYIKVFDDLLGTDASDQPDRLFKTTAMYTRIQPLLLRDTLCTLKNHSSEDNVVKMARMFMIWLEERWYYDGMQEKAPDYDTLSKRFLAYAKRAPDRNKWLKPVNEDKAVEDLPGGQAAVPDVEATGESADTTVPPTDNAVNEDQPEDKTVEDLFGDDDDAVSAVQKVKEAFTKPDDQKMVDDICKDVVAINYTVEEVTEYLSLCADTTHQLLLLKFLVDCDAHVHEFNTDQSGTRFMQWAGKNKPKKQRDTPLPEKTRMDAAYRKRLVVDYLQWVGKTIRMTYNSPQNTRKEPRLVDVKEIVPMGEHFLPMYKGYCSLTEKEDKVFDVSYCNGVHFSNITARQTVNEQERQKCIDMMKPPVEEAPADTPAPTAEPVVRVGDFYRVLLNDKEVDVRQLLHKIVRFFYDRQEDDYGNKVNKSGVIEGTVVRVMDQQEIISVQMKGRSKQAHFRWDYAVERKFVLVEEAPTDTPADTTPQTPGVQPPTTVQDTTVPQQTPGVDNGTTITVDVISMDTTRTVLPEFMRVCPTTKVKLFKDMITEHVPWPKFIVKYNKEGFNNGKVRCLDEQTLQNLLDTQKTAATSSNGPMLTLYVTKAPNSDYYAQNRLDAEAKKGNFQARSSAHKHLQTSVQTCKNTNTILNNQERQGKTIDATNKKVDTLADDMKDVKAALMCGDKDPATMTYEERAAKARLLQKQADDLKEMNKQKLDKDKNARAALRVAQMDTPKREHYMATRAQIDAECEGAATRKKQKKSHAKAPQEASSSTANTGTK